MSVLMGKAESATIVPSTTSVFEVVRRMEEGDTGAVVVARDGEPIGIFTSRDVMKRVVLAGLDAKRVPVGEAMTKPMFTLGVDADPHEAWQRMLERRVRHLPLVDGDGRVVGMLTMRRLLEEEADVLRSEATSLENYASYDGATG